MFSTVTNYTDINGNFWPVIFVFEEELPNWAWEAADGEKIFILHFDGFENALGFIE